MRRALVILTLLVLTTVAPLGSAAARPFVRSAMPNPTAAAAPAGPVTPAPGVTVEDVPAGCVGHSIGEPECGVKPQNPGDRGGWAQELLFLLVLGGMALIFFVIIRSTRARARAESRPE